MNNFEEKIGEVRLPEIGTEGCLQMFQIAWEIDHSAPTPRDPVNLP